MLGYLHLRGLYEVVERVRVVCWINGPEEGMRPSLRGFGLCARLLALKRDACCLAACCAKKKMHAETPRQGTVIIIIIIIKKDRQCKAIEIATAIEIGGNRDCHPISPETPVPHY